MKHFSFDLFVIDFLFNFDMKFSQQLIKHDRMIKEMQI